MTIPLLALAMALLPAAFAQNGNIFDVSVGPGGATLYDPPFITAQTGDFVRFTFNPKNHTVTQSSFDAPCVPLKDGASSGFQSVSNVSAFLPTWQFQIADASKPTWFHCEQTGHCGKGMVFAINPPADPDPHSFNAFQQLAIKLNGTGDASLSQTATATPTDGWDSYTAPPAQTWATATATVSNGASTWTTVYSSYDGTPQPTYAPAPMNHVIQVGINGLNYSPSNISAAIGDTVTFEFHPKNHTVTQSSFADPCKPLAETSKTGQVGFKSGFMKVDEGATTFPTFQITINDVSSPFLLHNPVTAPIWGYCGQQGPPVHCTSGMVFSINAVESGPNNFAAFKNIAMRGAIGAIGANNGAPGSGGSGTGSGAAPGSSDKPGAAVVGARVSYAAVGVLGAVAGLVALL
ncbi:Cupredoxin [Mycena crocata]|nr:Cupredoxin [Mycena crocata]